MKNNILHVLDKLKYFGFRKLYWIGRNISIASHDYLIDLSLINSIKDQSIIKRTISRKIVENCHVDSGQNINLSQFFLGFGLIHYSFIRNIKPTNILCIGSRKGFIPVILALACKDNNFGHVDFVDAGYDQDDHSKHWSGVGFWKKGDVKEHFARFGVSSYLTTYVMTTKEFAVKYPERTYQYIYIDGDHSYEGVKLDYKLFWKRLEKNGFMSFHDVIAKGYLDKGLFGVWKLWAEIKDKNSIVFPFPKDSGLGFIQKLK